MKVATSQVNPDLFRGNPQPDLRPSSAPALGFTTGSRTFGTVDTSQRLRHIINYINYRDVTAPRSKKKPAGVANCEIWAKVGAPAPTDISQLTYPGNASVSPQMEEFTGAQVGQMVCYWLRWVNTRGEKGLWSEPVAATSRDKLKSA